MWDHLAAQVTYLFTLQTEINDGVWPVGEVDDGAGECFVQRCVTCAEA